MYRKPRPLRNAAHQTLLCLFDVCVSALWIVWICCQKPVNTKKQGVNEQFIKSASQSELKCVNVMTCKVRFRHLSLSDYMLVLWLILQICCRFKCSSPLLSLFHLEYLLLLQNCRNKPAQSHIYVTFISNRCQWMFALSHCVFVSLILWQWWEDTLCFWADRTERGCGRSLYTSRGSFKLIGHFTLVPGNTTQQSTRTFMIPLKPWKVWGLCSMFMPYAASGLMLMLALISKDLCVWVQLRL